MSCAEQTPAGECSYEPITLCMIRNDSFEFTLTWQDQDGNPIDLTGYTAKMQIRKTVKSNTVVLELTSDPAGGIELGGTDGTIRITITAAQAALTGLRESGVWDVELSSDDTPAIVTTIAGGDVQIRDDVTR